MTDSQSVDFVQEYWIDAWQRSILSLDVLRQRGNIYQEQSAKNAPNVLSLPVRARPRRTDPAAAGQLHAGAHRLRRQAPRWIRRSRRSSSSTRAPATVRASAA